MSALRIVVLGYLVRCPIGGMAWHHLQYVVGLAGLGHEVHFIEDSGDEPWACYDPQRGVTDADPSYGLDFAARTFARLDLARVWAYHDALAGRWHGPVAERAMRICSEADVVVNLSGANLLRPWLAEAPVRIYVDTDPVFTQLRHLADPARRARAEQHTAFFTFGENFRKSGCTMPDDGLPWTPTRQPVVLSAWPVTPPRPDGYFTTVMQWDSYAVQEHEGRTYGMKSMSFMDYLDLPRRVGGALEIALGSETAPRALLREHGWRLRDPLEVTRDPWTYREFIQASAGEFSVAKQGYAVTRCGWFSERSLAYLASGRPVAVQNTGFPDWLDGAGEGVVAFSSPEGAVEAIERVRDDLPRHAEAARSVAETHFDARRVLTAMLEQACSRD